MDNYVVVLCRAARDTLKNTTNYRWLETEPTPQKIEEISASDPN
jgi:hypothetical protein